MDTRTLGLFTMGCLAAGLAAGASASRDAEPRPGLELRALPLRFERNLGQAPEPVRYQARGLRHGFQFLPHEVRAVVQGADGASTVRLSFGPHARVSGVALEGEDLLPSVSHYLQGNDPSRWRRNVPHFGRVRYAGLYEGIDLVFYGRDGLLEYDFVVAPGADPRAIRLEFEGVRGATLNAAGDLVLATAGGELVQHAPVVYTRHGAERRPVPGRYVRTGPLSFGFRLGAYDRQAQLVIDPVLQYSTFLGGDFGDAGYAIAVDASGAVYVAGDTASTDFPTQGPLQGNAAGTDAFVARVAPGGSTLTWCTYFGGNGGDTAFGLAVDIYGAAVIAGNTSSSDFPSVNGLQADLDGTGLDGFLTRFNPQGSAIVFSTLLGGTGSDSITGLALAGTDDAVVVGSTDSTNFPTTPGVLQPSSAGYYDGFVARVAMAAPALVYATYLGGSNTDSAAAVALDPTGSPVVAGYSASANFPTTHGPTVPAGIFDTFVTKLNPGATAVTYSRLVGGVDWDTPADVGLDAAGNAFVAGSTSSNNFPVVGGVQAAFGGGGNDAFVFKVSPSGDQLLYSTYLGGSGWDLGSGLAVDAQGEARVVGRTESSNFPLQSPIYGQPSGGSDVFLTRLAAGGGSLVFSTLLGGAGNDYGMGVALDPAGSAYVTGETNSGNFPILNAFQTVKSGHGDVFIARITNPGAGSDLSVTIADSPAPVPGQGPADVSITVANGGSYSAVPTLTVRWDPNVVFDSYNGGNFACTSVGVTLTCVRPNLVPGQQATLQLHLLVPSTPGRYAVRAQITSGSPDPIPENNSDADDMEVQWVKGDLNYDLNTDLVLCNTVTPQCAVWFMNGTTRSGPQAPISPAPASLDWALSGVDDFNQDSQNDLVMWNRTTGVLEFWIMDGTGLQRLSLQPISNAPTLAPNWRPTATADFDNDGKADLLWRNTVSQKLVVWLMNGTSRLGALVPQPDQAVDANWEVVGAPDVNQDGHPDLLWYHSVAGRIVFWFLDGQGRRTYGRLAYPASAGGAGWKVLASGDYGVGPGGIAATADLVWRNSMSGRLVVWHMDRAGNRTAGVFTNPDSPTPNPLDWTVGGPR